MSLENIPTKNSIEIETVKLDENIITEIRELNQSITNTLTGFGEVHIRRKELADELIKMDELQKELDEKFNKDNESLKKILNDLNEKYPGGNLNIVDGTIQYRSDLKKN